MTRLIAHPLAAGMFLALPLWAAADSGHETHTDGQRPTGIVDVAARATLRVETFDPCRFQPMRIEVRAGVPTRIEIANKGAEEHSLVVKTPDGRRDWVHLHVEAGATDSATYRLNTPGTYEMRCTTSTHAERSLVGELVVSIPPGRARPDWNWR